jgi:hypothetical protein
MDTSQHLKKKFVAHYKIVTSKIHWETYHIALYGILPLKPHRKLCGTIFCKNSSKP